MDKMAMLVGYVVMFCGALGLVAFLAGAYCSYAYRKLLRDVPSWYYVQNAVAMYRKQYPPGRWAKDQLGKEWQAPKA